MTTMICLEKKFANFGEVENSSTAGPMSSKFVVWHIPRPHDENERLAADTSETQIFCLPLSWVDLMLIIFVINTFSQLLNSQASQLGPRPFPLTLDGDF